MKKPLIDKNGEVRELTAEDFKRARPAREVLYGILSKATADEMLRPKLGRPRKNVTKEHINIRLDAEILAGFKSFGRGWQSRMNDALREWLQSHKHA
jgi:uncharacterized protein (DUF4415 family)